mmetsp:Transcript_28556/g.62098  ORF Transcript_28556/g.62098 Transcript_28556/m.62098 type:complete len:706 (+) Transcript_28556:233-2350(+)
MAEAAVGEDETPNEPKPDPPANGKGGGGGDWSHPGGKPLEEIEVDSLVDGTVTNVGRYGVFVDFGAVKDALLRVPIKIGKRYKQGMPVTGAKVISCDVEAGKVVLEVESDNWPEAPPPKEKTGGGRGDQGGAGGNRRAKRDWTHEGATPLEELQEGDMFEGKVTNVSTAGVFVDIGAVRDARLNVKVSIGRCFRIGDVIQNCTIESIDLETGRMSVGIPDPEAAVADLPPKERVPRAKSKARAKSKSTPKAKGKAQEKGGAKARARSASQTTRQRGGKPTTITRQFEEINEGDVLDGVVVNKSTAGVFVDIGCGKDARLSVPRRLGVQFMIRDVLEGLRVEYVDYERRLLSVVLDDPEGAIQNQERAPKRSRSVPASSSSTGRGGGGGGSVPPADSSGGGRASRGAAPKRGARSMSPGARAGGASSKAKAKAAPPRASERSSSARKGGRRLPVVEFKAGASVNGVVTKVSNQGVHVDIGATTDGLLKLPKAIAKEFRAGDQVHGMSIDIIDKKADLITLSLEEPTLTGTPPPPNPRSKAKAKAKGKATAAAGGAPAPKAKAAPTSKDWSHPDGLTLEELKQGDMVDGMVTNVGPFGIFVNVGAVKDARLQVARADRQRFRKGDRIEGALVDSVDPGSNQLNIVLPFDISEAMDEDDHPAPRAKSAGRINSTSPSTQSRPARAKSVGKARAKAGSAPGPRRPQPRQ